MAFADQIEIREVCGEPDNAECEMRGDRGLEWILLVETI